MAGPVVAGPVAGPTLGAVRALVAMSGGVDSSVAAALALRAGHHVVGVTLKLWGGPSDSGCCSVADVEDARRVADRLGIDHHVFNYEELFEAAVVRPYVEAHCRGATPNPCVECNRHVKFGALLQRAGRLGFDALVTGHHARVTVDGGRHRLRRGRDAAKDQSYVLAMLEESQLRRLLLPVGDLTKAEVRAIAAHLGLRTAAKPDSQDVCFIGRAGGRAEFLGQRIDLHAGALVDAATGAAVGAVPAVELVTIGQRRGLSDGGGGARRYAVAVDVPGRRVVVGSASDVRADVVPVEQVTWAAGPAGEGAPVLVQCSAHGPAWPARWVAGAPGGPSVRFAEPQRRVAPGQTVAIYDPADPDAVVGSAVARPVAVPSVAVPPVAVPPAGGPPAVVPAR